MQNLSQVTITDQLKLKRKTVIVKYVNNDNFIKDYFVNKNIETKKVTYSAQLI